jgi:poly-beta-1,6-N-acetyl-D-glucosamine synthase
MIGDNSYVLVTAAFNEGKYIENTVASVIAQEARPTRWIIVSDGSTDDTDAIVDRLGEINDFIRLYRLTEYHPRNFAAQVNAINAGFLLLNNERFAFIGNLDADITLEPGYFRLLLDKFDQNPKLGLAGGTIHDRCPDGVFRYRKGNSVASVPHAVQLFRRECFEAIGGAYHALPYGGPDTYAETVARMKGWQVESFLDLPVSHHRPSGSAGGLLRGIYRQGKMDFSLGVSPLFEIAKLLSRVGHKPYLVGSMARFLGFLYSYFSGEHRAVSDQFMAYSRLEQRRRIVNIFSAK